MPIHIHLSKHRIAFATRASHNDHLLNSTSSRRYPKSEVERFWKMVCLVQFHDVLPGSAIEMVYDDVLRVRIMWLDGTRPRLRFFDTLLWFFL
jgi:alpha-mannosidase